MTHTLTMLKNRYELLKKVSTFEKLKIINVEEKVELDSNIHYIRITIDIVDSLDLFYLYHTSFNAGQNDK